MTGKTRVSSRVGQLDRPKSLHLRGDLQIGESVDIDGVPITGSCAHAASLASHIDAFAEIYIALSVNGVFEGHGLGIGHIDGLALV